MRLLLTQNVPYTRVHGGANRSNRAMLEGLAVRGHIVRVVSPLLATPPEDSLEWTLTELERRFGAVRAQGAAHLLEIQGVEAHLVSDPARIREHLRSQIEAFEPDRLLVSSEDPSQGLLDTALAAGAERVILLAHTLSMLPFGPQSFFPGEARARRVAQARGVVAFSRFAAGYIHRASGIEPFVFHPPHYGGGPFADLGTAPGPHVTIINPSAFKGLPIFLGLARALPHVSFAAVPSYATTPEDLASLRALPNVTLLAPGEIEDVLRHVRVLLVPSLGLEAFGMAVVDAMLRGIPVLTSNIGGLPEAALGAATVLPVRPIESWTRQLDTHLLPVPRMPEQDLRPWLDALSLMLEDASRYAHSSRACREAAHAFVSSLSLAPLEDWLQSPGSAAPRPMLAPSVPEGATTKQAAGWVSGLAPEGRSALIQRLRSRMAPGRKQGAREEITRAAREGALPASVGQSALWLLERLTPGSAVFNVPGRLRLRGELDVSALRQALNELLRRHESLRTSFQERDGLPVQLIAPSCEIDIRLEDLQRLDSPERERRCAQLTAVEARTPFELERAPLLRASVLRLAPQEHLALITTHHLVSDGWSLSVFVRELGELYAAFRRGAPSPLPEPPIQYADYSAWQHAFLSSPAAHRQLEYWKERLNGLVELALPTDLHPQETRSLDAESIRLVLPKKLATALLELGRREGSTLFMLLVAALQALLARFTGQTDISVGTAVAGRTRRELEPLLGYFLNTLVLRAEVDPELSFVELLRRVREAVRGAFDHQDIPFERVLQAVRPERTADQTPLFRTLFILHNTPQAVLRLDGLTVELEAVERGSSAFELTLEVTEQDTGLEAVFTYRKDVFERRTVESLAVRYQRLLEAATKMPDVALARIDLLTERERAALSRGAPVDLLAPPQPFAHVLFVAQARRQPDAIAIAHDEGCLSYGELDTASSRVARLLRGAGARSGGVVALLLEEGPDTVVAMLAVLRAGATFVFLDPSHPSARLAQVLESSSATCVLTDASSSHRHGPLLERRGVRVLQCSQAEGLAPLPEDGTGPAPRDAAYIAYTSGSSGRPKGVVQSHSSFTQFIGWMARAFELHPGRRIALWAPCTYDAAYTEIFAALGFGATLCMTSRDRRLEPRALLQWLKDQRVNLLQIVPSFCRELIEAWEVPLPELDRVLLSGEVLPSSLVSAWLERFPSRPRLINQYGPTECVLATWHEVSAADLRKRTIPVGVPLDGREILILSPTLEPCAEGMTGEICVRSPYLAAGYHGLEEETRRAFIPNPVSGTLGDLLYRTGDRGRILPDGTLEFLGRMDGEVKIRGNRVHLTEVEAALLRDERVREAVVVARRVEAEGDVRLAAFVVPREPMEAHALRIFLETQLPGFMVPASIELLDALPRTSTNKVDRVALAARQVAAPRSADGTPPRSALERTLAEIWREVLALPEVGIDDRFFEIGGQSLLMIRVQRRVEQALGREVPLVDLFRFPTIRSLAQHLGTGDASRPARASRPPPRSALGILRERRRPQEARTPRDEGEDGS